MAARTWLPTLYLLLHTLYTYCTRWSVQIKNHLSPENQVAFDTFVAALGIFLDIIAALITEGP
jgi:hypothetical protein